MQQSGNRGFSSWRLISRWWQKRPRPRVRVALPPLEALESRLLLTPNLSGASFSVPNFFSYAPGNLVDITYRVTNTGDTGTAGGFTTSFYLSRDGYIDPFSDYYLGSGSFPYSLNAGYHTIDQYLQITLPDISSFFWNGSGTYTIGMVVDSFNSVYEFNEFDNSNLAAGFDSSLLFVNLPSPDLVGNGASIFGFGTYQPGSPITTTQQIWNAGSQAAGYFNIAYYLSRDPYWDFSDVQLQSNPVFGVAAFSTYYASANLTLPAAGNAIWNGQSQYYILSVIDPDNYVSEANEFNNFGQGVGLDSVAITVGNVQGGGDSISNLPPTNFTPGALLEAYLDTQSKMLSDLVTDYTQAAKKVKKVLDITPLVNQIKNVQASFERFRSAVKQIGVTGSLALGSGLTWNSSVVELLERGLVYTFVEGSGAAVPLSARGVNSLQNAISSVKDIPNKLGPQAFQTAKTIFGWVGGGLILAGVATGNPFLAGAGMVSLGVSVGLDLLLKKGLKDVKNLDKNSLQQQDNFQDRQERQNSYENLNHNTENIPTDTELGRSLRDLTMQTEELGNSWDNTWEPTIEDKFDQLAQALNGGKPDPDDPDDPGPGGHGNNASPLAGQWRGDLYYPYTDEFGSRDIGGLMILKFKKKAPNGKLIAKGSMNFTVYDGNTAVKTSRSKSKLELQQVSETQFSGQITTRNPQGGSATTNIDLNLINGQLQGGLASNPQSSFTLNFS